jgi:hypothetical protein
VRHHENAEPLAEAEKNVARFIFGMPGIVEQDGVFV